MERLTKLEGCNSDGTPKAELVKRDGPFAPILQEVLAKLARHASRVLALSMTMHCREDEE